MKMKQLLTLTLAAAMVAGTSLTAGAATPGFNPAAQEDKDVEFDSSQESERSTEIPVYGYVGPDALLIDEDPDDEDNKPTPTTDAEYQINVSVPVKILWAVFESDVTSGVGTVTSPDYYIRNNSEQLSVSLRADSFAARTGVTDNTYVDDNWTEDLTLTKQNDLMKRNVALGKTSVTLGNLEPEQQMEFDVQGKLDVNAVDAAFDAATGNTGETVMESDLSNVLQPEYDLVLTIKAIAP